MIYGYIRASTDRQNTDNQRFEIQNFASRNSIEIDEWIEETVSSMRDLRKRKLGRLIRKAGQGDLIIASELSRLGRNLLQVMGMLNRLMDSGARVWTIKDGYRLGDDIPSKVLAFAFGLSAEIERKMISERTREALARVKAGGKALGRPLGRRNAKSKLSGRAGYVRCLLARGCSRAEAARKLRVHRDTLAAFLALAGS
jgi:DNA invertase Pin-like site-specific DNA recombinase